MILIVYSNIKIKKRLKTGNCRTRFFSSGKRQLYVWVEMVVNYENKDIVEQKTLRFKPFAAATQRVVFRRRCASETHQTHFRL